jgi:hypothetical protein
MICGHGSCNIHELKDGICPFCLDNENDDSDDYQCDCIDTSIDNEGFEICNECGNCVG